MSNHASRQTDCLFQSVHIKATLTCKCLFHFHTQGPFLHSYKGPEVSISLPMYGTVPLLWNQITESIRPTFIQNIYDHLQNNVSLEFSIVFF